MNTHTHTKYKYFARDQCYFIQSCFILFLQHLQLKSYFRYEQQISKLEYNVIPGLGENGEPAYLYGKDKIQGEAALAKKALNVVLSDKISLTRVLPDVRNSL